MFIGRKKELEKLSELIKAPQANIGVVYGRRRVGKSHLIKKSLENYKVLSFEGLEEGNKTAQLRNFLFQLSIQTGTPKQSCKTWSEAFYKLYEHVKSGGFHIVFDEFQWMANYKKGVVSELKMIWDQYISQIEGTTLLLCGSIASFMVKKVIKSKALYGRTSLTIHLKGFLLNEVAEFMPNKGAEELFKAYMVVGGIPKYLEILSSAPSIELAIREHAYTPNGYFVEEFERIFISHFGDNAEYQNILKVLAANPYGLHRQEIAKLNHIEPGGYLSDMLFNLQSAGFISITSPFDATRNSNKMKYFLTDPYLRFYFHLIAPYIDELDENMNLDIYNSLQQTGAYYSWQGRSFEYLCMDHAHRIVDILGFSGVHFNYGPYFQPAKGNTKGVQIDLLFSRADNVISLCEMKYSQSTVGKDIIPDIERKVMVLRDKYPKKTIQKVLILKEEASKELLATGYFYKIIKAEDLMIQK